AGRAGCRAFSRLRCLRDFFATLRATVVQPAPPRLPGTDRRKAAAERTGSAHRSENLARRCKDAMPPRRHLLAAMAFAGVAALLLISFAHGRDQGIYAAVGRTILEGGVPYRDAFDFKPP